eukprot:TRINITY_DN1872_c0_g1_i3.p1 TRINITY_DN1872_c0_g1~~TRINITY_DN1872_c0_g1_i3.p1  ORF type:complete len:776 (-),score=206.89 TRINITY_DN1872_c0_g1_i3:50-2377(-)
MSFDGPRKIEEMGIEASYGSTSTRLLGVSTRRQGAGLDDPEFAAAAESTPLIIRPGAHETEEDEEKYTITLGRVRISLRDVKIVIIFCTLLIGVVAFALQVEPEVDNTFALSGDYPLFIPLAEDYQASYIAIDMSIPMASTYNPRKVVHPDGLNLYVRLEYKVTLGDESTWLPVPDQYTTVILQEANSTHSVSEEDIEVDILYVNTFPAEVVLRLNFTTSSLDPIAIKVQILEHGSIYRYKELFGALVLGGMYVLIIFEIIDRTVSAIVGSFIALAVLSALGDRPSLELIVSWIEYNTLALLFGMMIIVGVSSNTGLFEWIAHKAYEMSKGNIWRLVLILSIFTGVVSGVLDSVTSVLLLTPVIVRLCKVGNIDPIPVLITIVMICNIGGIATAVGDPHMIIIVNNKAIIKDGLDFATVFFYMAPAAVIILTTTLFFLKWWYRREFGIVTKLSTPMELHLRKEIDIWRETAKCLNPSSPEERQVKEMLQMYIAKLQAEAHSPSALSSDGSSQSLVHVAQPSSLSSAAQDSRALEDNAPASTMEGLEALRKECQIHDKRLFIMCISVLSVVVFLFFIENFIDKWIHLPLAWVALLGAIVLMVLADIKDIGAVLHKVEWGTLIFFGALFVLIESVDRLGLVNLVGNKIAEIIAGVSEESRLPVACVLLVWFSSIASAIIDSIPYTTAMMPIVVRLSQDPTLNLPLRAMALSLALGTGLGSNGTLLGATANLVMAGLAEQYGFPIGFVKFCKVGLPVMFLTSIVGSIYVLVVFCLFKL